jgi:hypothetical protein
MRERAAGRSDEGAIMLGRKTSLLLAAFLISALSACNMFLQQPGPAAEPTQVGAPASSETQDHLPRSQAEVPRVTIEEAKAAIDNGEAIVVDVRRARDYQAGHIPGAIHIPLDEIEANPTGLDLGEDQWIITYCT